MNDFLDHLIDPAQKTDAWHDIRAGRFTSSQNYRIVAPGYREMNEEELAKRPKTGTGSKTKFIEDISVMADGAMTYILEKATEVLTGIPLASTYSLATQWGEEQEPIAREVFLEILRMNNPEHEYEITEMGFIPFLSFAGGSSDGTVIKDGKKIGIIEIKSPYNSTNHTKYVLEVINDKDPAAALKERHPDHYWQMQSNMLWSKVDMGFFISFDPRFIDERGRCQFAEIPANPADQKYLLEKLDAGEKIKQETINLLKQ